MKSGHSISRRELLAVVAACTAGVALAPDWVKWAFAGPDTNDIAEWSALEAAIAIIRGELTAEQYAEALMRRCDAERYLNVFISRTDREKVMEAARAADERRAAAAIRGLLHGVPIAITDSINASGLPATAGTRGLRKFRPLADAMVVARLRREGAIVLGKTNLHELSLGWTGNNQAFGRVRNPYDTSRIAGGSNSGTAAAIAARMTPIGLGEDTDGSIRIPAALCGIAALRPSIGRYPTDGVLPLSSTLTTAGPVARTVADLALMDAVLAGGNGFLKPMELNGVRLGVAREYYFSDLDAAAAQVAEQALAKLKDAGATLVEAEVPDLARLAPGVVATVMYHELRRSLPAFLAAQGAPVTYRQLVDYASPDIQNLLDAYSRETGHKANAEATYVDAVRNLRPSLQAAYRDYFDRYGLTAMIFPAVRLVAPAVSAEAISPAPDVEVNGRRLPARLAFASNTAPSSAAGLPGLVIPGGLTRSGLPVGLELDAPQGTDRELLALGLTVEKVLGRIPAPRV